VLLNAPPSYNLDYAKSFLTVYESVSSDLKDIEKTKGALTEPDKSNNNETGMSSKWMSERITAIKKAFEKALGNNAARPFLIASPKTNNHKTYALTLTEQQILGFPAINCCLELTSAFE
jgi:outer membrane receptor for ferric coprogen and ferric-rhodotorulic acid